MTANSTSQEPVAAEYSIDPQTLREIVTDVSAVEARILQLEELGTPGEAERIAWLRMTGRLEEAEELAWSCLRRSGFASQDFASSNALPYSGVAAALRLAHVLHWQGRFELAQAIFESARASIQNRDCSCTAEKHVAATLEAFALQHHGKLYFDRGLIGQALDCFRSSLSLRQTLNAPEDQLASSRLAIAAAESRI
ncbi:hypothetical protein [Glutamicibacter sp. Je.9.36]|uniref:hypothetical protein n=1 Tax=Glutamicibacter sp. Je.9.36 TaxID=3142837 RepID=UPI003DAA0DD7